MEQLGRMYRILLYKSKSYRIFFIGCFWSVHPLSHQAYANTSWHFVGAESWLWIRDCHLISSCCIIAVFFVSSIFHHVFFWWYILLQCSRTITTPRLQDHSSNIIIKQNEYNTPQICMYIYSNFIRYTAKIRIPNPYMYICMYALHILEFKFVLICHIRNTNTIQISWTKSYLW